MAQNYFDQFDEQEKESNFFDQFDESLDDAAVSTDVRQQNRPQPVTIYNDPRGSLFTVGSGFAGKIAGGYAGLVGAPAAHLFGLAPEGEKLRDTAARYVRATEDAITIDPINEASARTLDTLNRASEAVSRVGREIPAAMATGSVDPAPSYPDPLNVGEKQQVREDIRQQGIGKYMAESAAEAGAPPSVSTALEVGPMAVASALGFAVGRLTPAQSTTSTNVAREATRRGATTADEIRAVADEVAPTWRSDGSVSVGRPSLDQPVDMTPVRTATTQADAENIATNLRRRREGDVAESVVPDQAIIESAERLNVSLNPEHYSTNAAFQDVARALKSQTGSRLEAAERQALQDLSDRADDVVRDIAGTLDKGSVSENVRASVASTIDDLRLQARDLYKKVDDAIPKATRINPKFIKQFLENRLAELGGNVKDLNPLERKLLRLSEGNPTYALLDRVRKDIGSAYQRQGPYADVASHNLDEVYGLLSDMQQGVAKAFGVDDVYAQARGLVGRRKDVEAASVQMFGRQLSNSLVPQMKSAATGLSKGDVGKFNRMMQNIPGELREQVAATVLNDLFSGGSRQGGSLGQGFVSTYANLKRNKSAEDALFRYLPDEARQRFNDIGRVLTGIVRSNQKPMANPSGSAGGIIRALEEGSALQRIYDTGRQIAVSEGVSSAVGVPGAGTALTLGRLWTQRNTPITVAADEMLASPQFARMAREATPSAERALQATPQYRRWESLLSDNVRNEIATLGFTAWLASDGEVNADGDQPNRRASQVQ